jgi:hypothetical protein
MPLDKFIAEVMEILTTQPTAAAICVENVRRLRFAAEKGQYDSLFQVLSQAAISLRLIRRSGSSDYRTRARQQSALLIAAGPA